MVAYHEQIVYAPSEDQRWMAGVLIQPNEAAQRRVGVICIHGASVSCYWPPYIDLGRALAQQGYLFLSGNTRVHDIASSNAPWPLSGTTETIFAYQLGGTGWSRFEEVAHDMAGWIEYVVRQGVEQVILVGHSFGVRCVSYYQAERQDPRIVGLILASGFDTVGAPDPANLKVAEELVAEGKGYATMPLPEGFPPIFALESAESVLDGARRNSPYTAIGHMPWIASIRVPILATVGTMDFIPNLREAMEDMRARAAQAPRFDLHVIDGADHFYTGRERELAQVVLDWLVQLPGAQKLTRQHWWNRK